jgi:hypothetical protein
MAIILDAGETYPAIVLCQGDPIVQLYRKKIKYHDKTFKPVVKDILETYHPDTYQYSPNPDYEAAKYVCDKLNLQGFECTVKFVQ